MKVLMFTKHTDICDLAVITAKRLFKSNLTIKYKIDEECYKWKGEYILSFINCHYIPPKILNNSRLPINWHTAPPKYAGTGGYSLALYNRDKTFGITVHVMDNKFDHGVIIDTISFPIPEKITIEGLLNLTHWYALRHFNRFIKKLRVWESKAYTRKDMIEINKQLQVIRPEVLKID